MTDTTEQTRASTTGASTSTGKIDPGSRFPDLAWQDIAGNEVRPARADGWRLIVVYRGKHCPLCRDYIGTLNAMRGDFGKAGITVWTLSADPRERAQSEAETEGWELPVLTGLSEDDMRTLGLYISSPRSPDETDRNFAEPATFVLNPEGEVQIVDISNAPFARPDLKGLLKGIRFVMDKGYPVRGLATA